MYHSPSVNYSQLFLIYNFINISHSLTLLFSFTGELNDDGQFRNAETTEDTTPDNGWVFTILFDNMVTVKTEIL